MRVLRLSTLSFAVLLLAACGTTGSALPSGSAVPSASPAASVAIATPTPTPTPYPTRLSRAGIPVEAICELDHPCFGLLEPGTHHSEHFAPAFEFTVPAGWVNFTQTGGYFDLGTVDAPGDSIRFLARPRPTKPDGSPVSGSFATPDAIAASLMSNEALTTTPAASVTVGGLPGVTLDLMVHPTASEHPTYCEVQTCVTFLKGQDEAPTWQWDLGIASSERIRLYLLETKDDMIAIAVDSLDGTTFDALTTTTEDILRSVRFDET